MLNNEVDNTLAERNEQYGSFAKKAAFIQKTLDILRQTHSYESLNVSYLEGYHMVMHKIARLIYGNPEHYDTSVDIIGYLELIIRDLDNNIESYPDVFTFAGDLHAEFNNHFGKTDCKLESYHKDFILECCDFFIRTIANDTENAINKIKLACNTYLERLKTEIEK